MNREAIRLFQELLDCSEEERERFFSDPAIDPEVRKEVESLLTFDKTEVGGIGAIVRHAVGVSFEEPALEQELCGPYRLLRQIGRGGMGVVYLAERSDGEVRQQVAIKLLRASIGSADVRQRFLQERQILADLAHPNIARLIDAGHRKDGEPYLVMEYIDGQPIDVYAAQKPLRTRVSLVAEVCNAISYAHRKLIIHRDLKPANILVDRNGVPKLLDFGIAKLIDVASDVTATIDRRMTPSYASPEQIRGRLASTATDIYSLGAVLYKILTGSAPFSGKTGSTPAALEAAICEGGVSRPSQIEPHIDKDLDAIVLAAMRREPEERYATADRFADDLCAWLELRPVRARRGGWWYLTRRYLRRYWAPVTAGAVAFGGLAGGLLVAQHERDIAQHRFHDVRQLATELFTIESDLQTVAGSTAARERIVKTALQYLERLSKEAGNDLELKSEIAATYRKVADIQGGFRRVNLGKPKEALASLGKSEAFFREVLKSRPKDPAAVRNLLETVEAQSRIHYGQKQMPELAKSIVDLRELTSRYEAVAPPNAKEWDFLGEVLETASLGLNEVRNTDDALKYAERALGYEKKAAAANDTARMRSNVASALSSYARMLRAEGDLDSALRYERESLALAERLAAEGAGDFRVQLNLATGYNRIAQILGEENSISYGRFEEAMDWFKLCHELNVKTLETDPNENQIRYNLAINNLRIGNVLRHWNPAEAVPVYDAALDALRAMPSRMASRDLPMSAILAESAMPLRMLHREAEARKRIEEAKRLAALYKLGDGEPVDGSQETISRAEADLALGAGKPAEAAAIHQAWLERVHYGQDNVQKQLRTAVFLAQRYHLLSQAYRAAGQPEQAEAAATKRTEILEFWRQKPRSKAFAEMLLKDPSAGVPQKRAVAGKS